MKLKFSIDYSTSWGQQLVIVLTYYHVDGSYNSSRLIMQTDDGEHWSAETSVLENRRCPVDSFSYIYTVEDSNGIVERREWNLVARSYAFDSAKTYIMADRWRDIPLTSHLYSAAYKVSSNQNSFVSSNHSTDKESNVDSLRNLRLPLFRKTVLFRVSAPQLQKGEKLAIIGSHPALGSWNPTRYQLMSYAGQSEWMFTLNVDWMGLPLEYKYVVVNEENHDLVAWEEGYNRIISYELNEGEVFVSYGEPLRLAEKNWRIAGVSVPVFSLRSEHSCGVGDFGDLKRFVDWAYKTGMKVIQLLPVNDTSVDGSWGDSYPYNIVSAFALHPHYLDLEQLGTLKDKKAMNVFLKQKHELNALSYSDYVAVGRVKMSYAKALFAEKGEKTLNSAEFKSWESDNDEWLNALDLFHKNDSSEDRLFSRYVQYHLHVQLKDAADYARSKGIFLKGDLPIGVSYGSAETLAHPEFFNMNMQTGVPPDAFAINGQNWGFPTYRWEDEDRNNDKSARMTINEWFQKRLSHLSQYFDALRIDHILGFFRIWEIPVDQIHGSLGHFYPALPLTSGEIEYYGLSFKKDFLTKPFINEKIIDRIFGIHAQYVRDTFLEKKAYGLYGLREEVDTQKKIRSCFEGKGDENSLWIRDGLYRLVANVLFVEDPRQPEMYHPRILAYKEPVFESLSMEERDAYMRLYNNFFYQRHSMFWGNNGYNRLMKLFSQSPMLICAEDLGMLPDCVEPVLDSLRILTLEIQQMPKQTGVEFTHLEGNPIRSVATISTHDMAPLRLWWEESSERTQLFYTTMLQKQGRAPEHLPAHIAEEIIARHLYCPSMLCILSLQDWLAMDAELWNKNPHAERINVPSSSFNHWQWRMHIKIEELLKAERFNSKIKTMIERSRRFTKH